MSVERLAAANLRLREGRLWRLLGIHHAPLVLAILQSLSFHDSPDLHLLVAAEF